MTTKTPLITAIVPNFNHGHLIVDCIDGLINQQFADFEVIILDDNSTDQSVRIIKKRIAHDKRFKLIDLEHNMGVLSVQNIAIEKVSSEYLYLAAADDYILPNFFSDLINILDKNPTIAFAGKKGLIPISSNPSTYISRPIFTPNNERSVFTSREAAEQLMKLDFLYITGACLIRTEMFKSIGKLDLDLGAFADGIYLRKLAVKFGYAFINDFGMVWRRDPSGFSATELKSSKEFNYKLNRIKNAVSADSNFKKGYEELLVRRIRFMSAYNRIISALRNNRLFCKKPILTAGVYILTFTCVFIFRPFPIMSLIKLLKSNKALRPEVEGLLK
jgi:glycosyltransferase involved in cell wall biosynthesis